MNYVSIESFAKSRNISVEQAKIELEKKEYQGKFKVFKGSIIVSTELLENTEPPIFQKEEEHKGDLEKRLEELQKRLEDKEKEVKSLNDELRDKNAQIAEFAIRFADLASQAQILHATEKKSLTTGETEEEPKEEKKPSFFKRLFGNR